MYVMKEKGTNFFPFFFTKERVFFGMVPPTPFSEG